MNISKTSRPLEILLVEDNPGDAHLTKLALIDSQLDVRLNVVEDGVEALDFLSKRGKYDRTKSPDLILLDLNLPKKDGRQVLIEIKNNPHLRHIPVVVLTTSQSEEDILNAYQLCANCYIAKPLDFTKFVNIVKSIGEFWFEIAELPN
jgi:two-component system response regulator